MLTLSKSVDIIIPTFRLDESFLLPLIHLPKPANWLFNYYIIADNPQVKPGKEISRLAQEGVIHLFINEGNVGPGESRNKGIVAGAASWILLLDDDIVADEDLLFQYVKAVTNHPQAIGFIGLTDFPPPINAFTKALDAAGLTAIFTIASRKDAFTWGVTANIMYRRTALQELRFSPVFSQVGGGEDIDLNARISIRNDALFKCIKAARVTHPWWNEGKPHYDRFARYGGGMALLLPRFKAYLWYAFPNPVESLVLAIISAPLFFLFLSWQKWLILVMAIPLFELGVNYLKALTLGYREIKVAYYMTLLRCTNEWEVLKTGLKHGCVNFMQRINVDFTRPRHFRTNRWRIIKLILFISLLIALIFC